MGTTAVAGLGTIATGFWRLRPVGSLFHIFAFAAISSVPNQPPLWQGMLAAVLTVAFSILLGLSGMLVQKYREQRGDGEDKEIRAEITRAVNAGMISAVDLNETREELKKIWQSLNSLPRAVR